MSGPAQYPAPDPASGEKSRARAVKWLVGALAVAILLLAFCRRGEVPALNIVVLDNTVPDESYREHQGLFEVLDGDYANSLTGKTFRLESDYYGFVPLESDSYTIRRLPERLEAIDLFYLADAYGVYTREFYGRNPTGQRSEKIYGGLSFADLAAIRSAIGGGATLVAEFNSFASPTHMAVREEITEILGVRWSGWMGRFFTNLSEGEEVPEWAVGNYERKYGTEWNFFGPGYILVNNENIVVLREKEEIGRYGVEFNLTDLGKKVFPDVQSAHYRYWFDIVATDTPGAAVLADYALKLTAQGEEILAREGIPSRFPAIVLNQAAEYTSFYFAGDYADRNDRLVFLKHNPEIAFFRRVYRPMMRTLLDHIAANRARPARFL